MVWIKYPKLGISLKEKCLCVDIYQTIVTLLVQYNFA